MNKELHEIRYFFNSQAFADGLRISFAILLPALISSYFDHFDIGLTISLGAMCVSLADAPGPLLHKKNGMLICSAFVSLIAFITVFARLNAYLMGLEIILVSFFFSMFNLYGNRATSVGNAAILIMILTMDKPVPITEAIPTALLILGGGLYYMGLSLLLYKLWPYRNAQRSLGECIREIAKYLSIKADFYDVKTDLDSDYRKLVTQQIIVHEKQDAVREILFKTRQILDESTTTGRKLVWTFVETVDLFENITASYYDYTLLREQFTDTGILEKISVLINHMANELDRIGISIQANTDFTSTFDYDQALKQIKEQIDSVSSTWTSTIVLKKIVVNLRQLFQGLRDLQLYFEEADIKKTKVDHTQFITHQSLDPKILWNNLSLKSSVFKHSIRVSLACIAGFTVAKLIGYGHHSYWILMTISFMLKPAFSLTKQRNVQRIIGTFAGGAVGLLILIFIPNKSIQFVFMVLFMIGTYSFMRINYLIMVIFTTPYILILFKFLGMGFVDVAKERILDTVIGCWIAFMASYFLFPHWESSQLKTYMQNMLRANIHYLSKIIEVLKGNKVNILDYKLVRKEVYVASANLSAAFQRMISEPKSKQTNEKHLHQFVVLNTILLSNIATVATSLLNKEPIRHSSELTRETKKALAILNDSIKRLGGEAVTDEILMDNTSSERVNGGDDNLLKEQLSFISKVSQDIDKTVAHINVS